MPTENLRFFPITLFIPSFCVPSSQSMQPPKMCRTDNFPVRVVTSAPTASPADSTHVHVDGKRHKKFCKFCRLIPHPFRTTNNLRANAPLRFKELATGLQGVLQCLGRVG